MIDVITLAIAKTQAAKVVNSKVGSIAAGLTYKDSVSTVDDLPSSGNDPGDEYNVTSTNDVYVWNGTEWTVFIKGSTDIISYLTEAPTEARTGGLKIVILDSDPEAFYGGYLYFVLNEDHYNMYIGSTPVGLDYGV